MVDPKDVRGCPFFETLRAADAIPSAVVFLVRFLFSDAIICAFFP